MLHLVFMAPLWIFYLFTQGCFGKPDCEILYVHDQFVKNFKAYY